MAKIFEGRRSSDSYDLYFQGDVDPSSLRAELVEALEERVYGVSASGFTVVVHCALDLTDDEMERVADIVDRHDAQLARARREIERDIKRQRNWRDRLDEVTDPVARLVLQGILAELAALKGVVK